MDPPGLAFEGFDAIGRARTSDNGGPVDTSNLTVILPDNRSGTVVNGPVELAKLLATDPAAEICFAQKWLAFALGRDLNDSDIASLAKSEADFAASGFNIQALIVSVLSSDAFLAPP